MDKEKHLGLRIDSETHKKLKSLERAKKQMGAVVSLLVIMFIGV